MEVLGGVLALLSPFVLALGLVALFRPLQWARLGSRKRAAAAIVLSVVMFVVGVSMLPPAPGDTTVPSTPATEQPVRHVVTPQAATHPALADSSQALLSEINDVMGEMSRSGYSVRGHQQVQSGPGAGNELSRACADDSTCLLIEALPNGGGVQNVTLISGGSTAMLTTSSIAILAAVWDEPADALNEMNRQLERSSRGEANQSRQVGSACLRVATLPDLGLVLTITTPPCE